MHPSEHTQDFHRNFSSLVFILANSLDSEVTRSPHSLQDTPTCVFQYKMGAVFIDLKQTS